LSASPAIQQPRGPLPIPFAPETLGTSLITATDSITCEQLSKATWLPSMRNTITGKENMPLLLDTNAAKLFVNSPRQTTITRVE